MSIVQYYVQGRMDKINKLFEIINEDWFHDFASGFKCDGSEFTDDYLYCFILASAKNDYDMMKFLLKKYEWMDDMINEPYADLCKVCVNKSDCEHECPFRMNYKNIVNYFYDGMNAFIFACEENNLEMIKYLYNLHNSYKNYNKVSGDILYRGFLRLIGRSNFRIETSVDGSDNIYNTVKYYINNLMDEELVMRILKEINKIAFSPSQNKLYKSIIRLLAFKLFKLLPSSKTCVDTTHINQYINIKPGMGDYNYNYNYNLKKYDEFNYTINCKFNMNYINCCAYNIGGSYIHCRLHSLNKLFI